MFSKFTTIFSFHHKSTETDRAESKSQSQSSVFTTNATEQIVRVYVFKTHHNLQFSPQMLHYKINEGMCLQNPPPSSASTTNATEQIVRVYVFKTHHNLQFSPQMLHYKINEGMCLQNPPQSSVFTTNATEQNQ